MLLNETLSSSIVSAHEAFGRPVRRHGNAEAWHRRSQALLGPEKQGRDMLRAIAQRAERWELSREEPALKLEQAGAEAVYPYLDLVAIVPEPSLSQSRRL